MLPGLAKRWQFRTNLDPGRHGTNDGDAAAMFCAVKDALTGLYHSPWRVVSSSNGVGFNLSADVVRGPEFVIPGSVGDDHTWVVMTQPALPGLYCIDFEHPETMFMTVVWSPGGLFKGGTTKIRPGATDEIVLAQHAAWLGDWRGRDGIPMRAHVLASEDGKATRVVCATQNRARSMMVFEEPLGATRGWVDPSINLVVAPFGDAEAGSHDSLWEGAPAKACGPAGPMALSLTGEGYTEEYEVVVLSRHHTRPTQDGYDIVPIGLWHDEVAGQRGHHGFLADLWWTSSELPTGTTFPSDGTKQFVVFGDMLFPWNGSKVELG